MQIKSHKRKVQPIKTQKDIEKIISYFDYYINIYENMNSRLALNWTRNKFLFLFGINSALRISDILDLKVSDVEKGYIQIKDKKTKKYNQFELNKKIINLTNEYLSYTNLTSDNYLFNSFKQIKINGIKQDILLNSPVTYQQVNKMFKKIEKELELNYNINTHSLRKTYGFHYYKQTKDIYALMHILNHSNVVVTQKYIGLYDEEKNKSRKDFTIGV